MGLLSDPSLAPRNKLGRSLAKHSGKICLLVYTAGLVWFVCLSHAEFNHSTYLSENALSPGLVYPEMKLDSSRLANTLLEDLKRERTDHKSTTPHAWIAAKMRQIGLETHVHNFTLRYPFSMGKEYHGKNIYGILRAPRIGSTEGIVFSAPYRAVTSVHADITASVPLLLAFADFARKHNYWAKDLIFLVTEQEQLGMHAWLEAYHEGGIEDSAILSCGNLPARAGALQAALNLEIQDLDIDYIDVKIEGLNGQLPNLDMFNLVQRITQREGISSGYKQMSRKKRHSLHSNFESNLRHMIEMIISQTTGVPNGNHGLFHRYRIESLTLEAVRRNSNSNSNRNNIALPLLKTVEGISRSLNNLLERFHQSYFFYILIQNDRFVSIGDFIPALILMASTMFIKAFLLWLTIDGSDGRTDAIGGETVNKTGDIDEIDDDNEIVDGSIPSQNATTELLPYNAVLKYKGLCFFLGILCNWIPTYHLFRDYLFKSTNLDTATAVGLLLLALVLLGMAMPFLITLPDGGLELLHIGALICTGVALIVLGLLNFALGFILAIICVPLAILISTESSSNGNVGPRKSLATLYAFFLNPLITIYGIVFVMTLFQFPNLLFKEILVRAITATMDAITFALMDCMIYGNWLYRAITLVFFPLWILFWTLAQGRRRGSTRIFADIKQFKTD